MIDEIKNNIDTEITLINEAFGLFSSLDGKLDEKRAVEELIESHAKKIKILNQSTLSLIKSISLINKLPGKPQQIDMEKITAKKIPYSIALRSQDKEKYLKELSFSDKLLHKIKSRSLVSADKTEEYKKPNIYGNIANRIFLGYSSSLLRKGYFKTTSNDLRKANINVLTPTYVSMVLLTTALGVIFGIALFIFLMLFSVGFEPPFIFSASLTVTRFLIGIFFLGAIPTGTFFALYYYPRTEIRSMSIKIDSELPFAVIHMGSIAGSGVEPSQIFKIVGLSKEYKYIRTEMRKMLNQINIYGYDLVTALQNVARLTPSARLSELLSGLSVAISSGGDLKTFFEKRAETLLLNYRLEREKFTKVAETFMDIYISVVIAAPMILLLLLVMISVSGVQIGFGINQLTFLIVAAVIVINIIFLWVLSMKQPAY